MAIETTPLGFQKPDGNEPVSNGDNVISANAQKAEDLHATARARLANLDNAAGFTGDPLALNDAAVAEAVKNGTASHAELDARLEIQNPPIVADIIANDPTVANSAATMAQNTAGLVPVWKATTSYTAGQRVIAPNGDVVAAKANFTTTSAYVAANWTASTQDGRIGTLETTTATKTIADATGGVVGGMVDTARRATWLTHDSTGGPTEYARKRLGVETFASADAAGGFRDNNDRATWLTHDASGGPTEYAAERVRGVIASDRHALLENELRLKNGGTIRTNGAAPVCLIFDHGAKNFRDIVLPLLRARGLPSVLALNSRMYDPAHVNLAENAGTTWAEIDGWTVNDKVEIANHGATHSTAAFTPAETRAEILNGLTELRTNLPSKPILTWVQPAANYPGNFNNGDKTSAWTDTTAGNTIYAHHAVATGTMQSPTHPLMPRDGNPLQGIAGHWFEGAGSPASAKTRVQDATAAKKGILLRHHPARINLQGYATTAELTDFFDFLAAEQTAGRIKVLNLSEWSIADTGI